MLSWYNILHTVSTQVHTVHTAASRGRQRLHGSHAATHSTKSRLKRHTCTGGGASDRQVRWVEDRHVADQWVTETMAGRQVICKTDSWQTDS